MFRNMSTPDVPEPDTVLPIGEQVLHVLILFVLGLVVVVVIVLVVVVVLVIVVIVHATSSLWVASSLVSCHLH